MQKAFGAHCDVCPLRDEPHALGQGPDKARVVIVGEAPGAQEVRTGLPFTGPSGNLLNKILQADGIKREEVYVTNATLCRPPTIGNKNTPPPTRAIQACRDRLIFEIRARHPDVVIPLGNTAAQTLLDTRTGITELRKVPDQRSALLGDVRILPTFHPAAALRNGDYLPSIVADIKRINHVQVKWEATRYRVAETIEEGISYLRKQLEHPLDTITCDIENSVEGEERRKNDTKQTQWLCIGISHRPGAAIVYSKEVIEHPEWRALLNKGFQGPKRWGWQNGKYDIQHLWGSEVPDARVDEDTMLAHYMTDERKGTHDLEQLATEVLGAPRYKTDAKAYLPRKGASLRHLPSDVLYQYNAGDVDVTHRLLEPLQREMVSDNVERPYRELMIPGSNALAVMEYWGIKVDRERLDTLHEELSAKLDVLEAKIMKEFHVGNIRSPEQLKEAFLDSGVPLESTAKEILAALDHPLASAILAYRKDHKLLSTYVRGVGRSLIRGRIHPSFLLHGTETGRLSCRRPNLQNQPSGHTIRDIYVAGPDNVLLQADYSQIEFRLAAIFSGSPWLLDQFKTGRQFHKEVANRFFGIDYTDLQYLRAKAINFGILYERGAKSLAEELGISMYEAQRLIDEFFVMMPEVKKYQKGLHQQVRQSGHLRSYFGRVRRFWLVTQQNWHIISKEAVNFPLQSTASDLTLKALIRLTPLIEDKAIAVITVHDSIVFEVKRQYLQEVARLVKEVMEDTPFKDTCPTPVELSIGRRWGSHKGKPCPYPEGQVCDHLKEMTLAA